MPRNHVTLLQLPLEIKERPDAAISTATSFLFCNLLRTKSMWFCVSILDATLAALSAAALEKEDSATLAAWLAKFFNPWCIAFNWEESGSLQETYSTVTLLDSWSILPLSSKDCMQSIHKSSAWLMSARPHWLWMSAKVSLDFEEAMVQTVSILSRWSSASAKCQAVDEFFLVQRTSYRSWQIWNRW